MRHTETASPRLLRRLSALDATALVVGTIIGTGIFLKASVMSQTLGSSWLVLLVWIAAGALSLAGALTYAELGCLFPRAGGEYIYLREAYGDLPAFLFGWMRFWIGAPGSIAAFAVGLSTFLSDIVTLGSNEVRSIVAIGFILFFTMLNCLSVSVGGKIITIITTIKIFLIVSVPIGAILLSPTASWTNLSDRAITTFSWGGFGSAMLSALWAFDGWNNLPMMAGEITRPEKNIPRALIFGTLLVLGVYGLVNFSYFYALPFSEVVSSSSKLYPEAVPVAGKLVQSFLGSSGLNLFSILVVISVMGAMNGSVMSSSRVPYALAKDGLFPEFLAKVSLSNHVPYRALIIQGIVAAILASSRSFDQLTDYVVFASWIFYGLVACSVFVFRRRLPYAERTYRVLGYPFVPAIFVILAGLLVINTLRQSPSESVMGMIFILIGIPAHYFFGKHRR